MFGRLFIMWRVCDADEHFPWSYRFPDGGGHVDSIVTAVVTGVLTLLRVLFSNSQSQAVIEVKINELSRRMEKL